MDKCCGNCAWFQSLDSMFDKCNFPRPKMPADWPSSAIVMIASVTPMKGTTCPCHKEKV